MPGFLITTGWGTWGFKAIPAGGEQMAELIATGRTPELIAPFSLDAVPPRPRARRPGVGGDAVADARARLSALRPPSARRVRRSAASVGRRRRRSTIRTARDFDEVWIFENPDGIATERWFHAAGCRRWLTVRRDTSVDRVVEVG